MPEGDLEVEVPVGDRQITGSLTFPAGAEALVIFSHGSGSSRFSPRDRFVADRLHLSGLGTLLLDLLTADEERTDAVTRHLRFDVGLLARRVVAATDWVMTQGALRRPRIGYFGASTGAAAALIAAARRDALVGAVVSRGGRPDLAGQALRDVRAPTLLLVGAEDRDVVALNQQALRMLGAAHKELRLIPRATHLFEEPGAIEQVARLAAGWCETFLAPLREATQPSV